MRFPDKIIPTQIFDTSKLFANYDVYNSPVRIDVIISSKKIGVRDSAVLRKLFSHFQYSLVVINWL